MRVPDRVRRVSWPVLGLLWLLGVVGLVVLDQLVLESPAHPAAAWTVDWVHPLLRVVLVGALVLLTVLRIRERGRPGSS